MPSQPLGIALITGEKFGPESVNFDSLLAEASERVRAAFVKYKNFVETKLRVAPIRDIGARILVTGTGTNWVPFSPEDEKSLRLLVNVYGNKFLDKLAAEKRLMSPDERAVEALHELEAEERLAGVPVKNETDNHSALAPGRPTDGEGFSPVPPSTLSKELPALSAAEVAGECLKQQERARREARRNRP